MAAVTVYSSDFCPYCMRAKALLRRKGVAFDEICVDGRADLRSEMAARAGRNTVPQIWIGQHHVGGCDDLHDLERRGELDALLVAPD